MKLIAWLLGTGKFFLGCFLLSISPFLAGDAFAEMEATFHLNNGYRVDDLDWSIAGNTDGNDPNILSELTWSDLKIYQIKADGRVILGWFYLRGSIGYGWILDGENQDSDYSGDDRALEFSRSNNSSDNGNVMDASVGVGYQFKPGSSRLRITPLVGYSRHEQNLTLTDGVQTLSEPSISIGVTPAPVGPISGLDSTYDTKWKGPWAGIDLSIEASSRITLFGSFEYHWADYEAEGNWNLRGDFAHPVSFKHTADGNGFFSSAGGVFTINNWRISVTVDYHDWSTDAGTDRTFFAVDTDTDTDTDTTTVTSSVTRLNEVNWSSFAVMLGVTYRF